MPLNAMVIIVAELGGIVVFARESVLACSPTWRTGARLAGSIGASLMDSPHPHRAYQPSSPTQF